MGQIKRTENYSHQLGRCKVQDCERLWCGEHRVLYRSHDAATLTHEGSGRPIFEIGDAPCCVWDEKEKRHQRLWEQMKATSEDYNRSLK